MSGDSLRVYDDKGELLEDFGPPPEGKAYAAVTWSPDSSSLAYIVVPEDFVPGI